MNKFLVVILLLVGCASNNESINYEFEQFKNEVNLKLDKFNTDFSSKIEQIELNQALIEQFYGELMLVKNDLKVLKKIRVNNKDIYYIVKDGDSLWLISENELNDPFKWVLLYKLNSDIIVDPDLIYKGQRLIIERK